MTYSVRKLFRHRTTSLPSVKCQGKSNVNIENPVQRARIAAFFVEQAGINGDLIITMDKYACELNPWYRHSQQRRDNLARLRPPLNQGAYGLGDRADPRRRRAPRAGRGGRTAEARVPDPRHTLPDGPARRGAPSRGADELPREGRPLARRIAHRRRPWHPTASRRRRARRASALLNAAGTPGLPADSSPTQEAKMI